MSIRCSCKVSRVCYSMYCTLQKHITLSSATYEKVSTGLLLFSIFYIWIIGKKISFNICVTILIFTAIYEGSQNTCDTQKIFQWGPVLLPTHVTNETQRWHSWNFPKWLLPGAGKGHLALWASSLNDGEFHYQICCHVPVRDTNILCFSKINMLLR